MENAQHKEILELIKRVATETNVSAKLKTDIDATITKVTPKSS